VSNFVSVTNAYKKLRCHAKYNKGGFSQTALLSSLPLQACSVWPRNIERYSIVQWGRGQNKRIKKKKFKRKS